VTLNTIVDIRKCVFNYSENNKFTLVSAYYNNGINKEIRCFY